MGMNMIVFQVVNEFKRLNEVVAITLAGSCASGRKDNYSDIDIDIITEKEIPVEKREIIIKKFADILEVNNDFWGISDEFVLRNSSIHIDIAYFDINWLKDQLENVIDNYNASMGYTTCFWHNVIDATIIYGKNDEFAKLQQKYKVPYPQQLKKNIITKNHPVLRDKFSSYYNQIERAINRKDLINLNNRITRFLESYFDIVFAINELPHPGEKRLASIVKSKCKYVPVGLEENLNILFRECYNCNGIILATINNMVDELDILLRKEKVII